MLRSLTLDNFQSFDHIELDLTGKHKSIKNHAFIYGENGSGKSNLINSIFLLMVSSGMISPLNSTRPADETMAGLARELRMIDSDGNTKLDFVFNINDSDARYIMEFDNEGTLVKESLNMLLNARTGTIFRIEKGKEPYLTRELFTDRTFKEKIRSLLSQYWGRRSFVKIIYDETKESNDEFIHGNINCKLLLFIAELKNTVVLSKSFNTIYGKFTLPNGEIDIAHEKDLDVLETQLSRFYTRLYTDIRGLYFRKEHTLNNTIKYELYFKKNIADKVRDIPARLESTGTLKMIDVLGTLMCAVEGRTVFVDELDSGIHDIMITDVMEQTIPDISGQLVVTTHNTCLMESLSPENVYVIGIDRKGYKRMRCVSSIEHIRTGNNIRNKYLDGNFLGIPYLGELGLKGIMMSK